MYRDLRDPRDLLGFAAAVGDVVNHRSANADGFTDVEAGNENGFMPSKFVHTDGAGEPEPPDLVVVHCVQPSTHGGHSLLVDAHRLCTTLEQDHRHAFNAIRNPSIACIRSGSQIYRGPFLTRIGPSRYSFRFRPDLEEVDPKLARHLNTVLYAAGTVTERFEMTSGAGYVARNERWLHGRTGWTGDREARRLLINVSSGTRLGGRLPPRGFPLGGE